MTLHRLGRSAAVWLLASTIGAAGAGVAVYAHTASAAPGDLFFSEYVEGSGNNKALEIVNPSAAPVTLTGAYDVQIFANGSPTATATIPLVGTVAPGDVFVLARSSAVAAILAQADQTTTNFLYNGNDAVALRHGTDVVDVIGQIGADPGTEWGTAPTTTLDATLRRKAAVATGDANGADAFDPATQWDGLALDTFDGLGAHQITPGGGGGGGTNTLPDARDDAATLAEDGPGARVAVLANDVDADGDALSLVSATDPAHGIVTLDGSVAVYVPDVDYAGADSFRYTVRDARGGEDSALVAVSVTPVQDDPEADDDAATTREDASVVIDLLANDADVDGDAIAVATADAAAHGTVAIRPDGRSVTYTPAADVNGVDTFEYTVGDGHGGSDVGLVTVTVTPVNDPPRPRDDSAATAGGPVDVPVLANDVAGPADEAGQTLAVASVAAPGHGTATALAGGLVRYAPAAGYVGPDSFTYVVSDGELTATATVRVDVTGQQATPELCSVEATIAGTPGDDVLRGTPGDDVIRAGRGNDVIEGLGGNDLICGGSGNDRIVSGSGNDVIAGGTGDDQLDSGAGDDRVRGGGGADTIATRTGSDRVTSGNGADVVDTGDGHDVIAAGNGDDRLTAGAGDDRLDGGAGTDSCDGGEGRNSLIRCE